MNLGCIHGGDNPNRICSACELHIDLRALPGMNNDELRNEIDSLIQPIANQAGTPATISPLFPGVEAYEEAADSELTRMCEKLTNHTAASVAFATEAPFLKQMGMQTIVMGPGSIDQAHQPNEYIDHGQIAPAVNTIRGLIEAFCLRAC